MIKKLQTIKERIGKIVEKWYIIEPLCFITWTTHELAINTAIKTIRTGKGELNTIRNLLTRFPMLIYTNY